MSPAKLITDLYRQLVIFPCTQDRRARKVLIMRRYHYKKYKYIPRLLYSLLGCSSSTGGWSLQVARTQATETPTRRFRNTSGLSHLGKRKKDRLYCECPQRQCLITDHEATTKCVLCLLVLPWIKQKL